MQKIRKNVLGVVLCKDLVLVVWFTRDKYWGFPKGGIEEKESAKEALKRELIEELNIKEFEFLGKSRHKLVYDLPKKLQEETGFKGKEHTVFFVKVKSKKVSLKRNELSDHKWIKPEEMQDFFDVQNQKELSKKILPEISKLTNY